MRKLIIGAFLIIGFLGYGIAADAYSINWGEWMYYGGVSVSTETNQTGYGEQYFGTTTPIEIKHVIGPSSGYAYGYLRTNPFVIDSVSEAESDSDETRADSRSIGAIYNTFTVSGGGDGELIPFWLTIDLEGYLEGYLGDDGYNGAGFFAALWIEEVGTLGGMLGDIEYIDNFEELIGGAPAPLWASYEGDDDIVYYPGSEYYRELLDLYNGESRELLAILGTFAYTDGDARAYSNFGEFDQVACLKFNIEPVPEPATMFLFGLGALGFGAFKRRRK